MNHNRPEAWGRLYGAASRLAAYMGAHGSVEAKSDLGALLVEALDGIDGANYCPGLMPATVAEVGELRDECDRLRFKLEACMASRDALRDWAQECRNQVLYLLAQQDNELGRVADGLGQASVGLLGHNKS